MPSAPDHVDRILAEWRRERPDLDVRPMGVIGRLHRLADVLNAELAVVFREFDLGPGEFDVLASLRRAGSPFERTPGELADSMMITSGAVTKRVDGLVDVGLVTRRVSETDARGRVVALTPHGHSLIDTAYERHIANEKRLLSPLTVAEQRTLATLLHKWSRSFEADPT